MSDRRESASAEEIQRGDVSHLGDRDNILASLDGSSWDVVVIGGGVNGIGVFRDLAMQGVRVLLVERSDFCSGASAASSHMVHGGLRYLENGEFRLVREAVHERNLLLQNAPHQVHPLPTVVPIFKRFSGLLNAPLKFLGWLQRPGERGKWVVKIGLWLYDRYSRRQLKRHSDDRSEATRPLPASRIDGRTTALQRHPQLNPAVLCTATYYDAAMPSPERLAMEVLLDGVAASRDAVAINYVAAASIGRDSTGPMLKLCDQQTQATMHVRCDLLINAAGPWIDLANNALGMPTQLIGGTKGSHLVLQHEELRAAIGDSEFFFENKDGRIVLMYPLLNRVLVGTSDLPIENPDDARCSDAEVAYFLEMIQVVFPRIQVDRSHIVYRFSGVRPLPQADESRPGQISRDHTIEIIDADTDHPTVLNLVGGKWTTFRAFAEQAADEALKRLGRSRHGSTANLPIGGAKDCPKADQVGAWTERRADTQLPREIWSNLLARYGSKAVEVAASMRRHGADPVAEADTGEQKYYRGEIVYLLRHEMVVHLDDLLLRRTLLGMLGLLKRPLFDELVGLAAATLNWDDSRRNQEAERAISILLERHGVELT